MAFQYRQQRGGSRAAPRFVRLREAYHGDTLGSVSVGGIDPSTPSSGRCSSTRLRGRARRRRPTCARLLAAPTRARSRRWSSSRWSRARPACSSTPPATCARCASCATARRAPDLRRGGDRLRPHRDDVRLRAEGVAPDFLCLAKGITGGYLPLAATLTTERSTRPSSAPPRSEDLLPRPHLHRQPARLRRRAGQPRRLRAASGPGAAAAEDRAARRAARPRSPRCPSVAEVRRRGFMVGIDSASTTPNCGSATG